MSLFADLRFSEFAAECVGGRILKNLSAFIEVTASSTDVALLTWSGQWLQLMSHPVYL